MSEHVSVEDLQRLAAHQLDPSRIKGALAHIASCAECQRAFKHVPLFLTSEGDEHLTPDELLDLASGRVSGADLEVMETHLDDCAECRELLPGRAGLPVLHRRWLYAAAAVLAIALAGIALRFPRESVTAPVKRVVKVDSRPAEWQRLVDEAERTGTLPLPEALEELKPVPRSLRGDENMVAVKLAPQGVIVRSTRPQLQWPAFDGATYRVSLQRWGTSDVIESPLLRQPEWQVGRDLVRGSTYEWQVEVNRAGNSIVVPAPPAPRALFRIIEESAERELAAAEKSRPDDHELLAIMNARAGLIAAAIEQVDMLARDPRANALATRLAGSLRTAR